MMKWMLAAGAAALAITAPIAAERGGRDGGENAQSQKSDRGSKARAQRVKREAQAHAPRRGGGERVSRASRGGDRVKQRSARIERSSDLRRAQSLASIRDDRQERGRRSVSDRQRDGRDGTRARDGDRRANVQASASERIARGNDDRGTNRDRAAARLVQFDRDRVSDRGRDRRAQADDNIFQVRDFDRRGEVRFRDFDRDLQFARRLGFVDGCPPGLAKKMNGCLPPGQAAKFIGQPLAAAASIATLGALPSPIRSLYLDDDDYYYRYGGGYLYRVDRNDDLISSMIPLFGAALLGRQLMPSYVNSYSQPAYYGSFYRNSPYDCYQYGYGYVYETDCVTGMVEDVIPTYDYGYGVGQLMPASYGYYNVPFAYRSHFADDDDYYYRYAPGAIYRVDRDTALISAVAALLTGGMTVGQPLPVGYSAYNVPLAYRSTYYDRPDVWYRYNNGYIYAVDPGSQMVRSVAYVVA